VVTRLLGLGLAVLGWLVAAWLAWRDQDEWSDGFDYGWECGFKKGRRRGSRDAEDALMVAR
jgi:hypothetical protein